MNDSVSVQAVERPEGAPHSPEVVEWAVASKVRTSTALGSYRRAMPRSIEAPQGLCVYLISSNPCRNLSRISRGGGHLAAKCVARCAGQCIEGLILNHHRKT